jgi:hypothetical protein
MFRNGLAIRMKGSLIGTTSDNQPILIASPKAIINLRRYVVLLGFFGRRPSDFTLTSAKINSKEMNIGRIFIGHFNSNILFD